MKVACLLLLSLTAASGEHTYSCNGYYCGLDMKSPIFKKAVSHINTGPLRGDIRPLQVIGLVTGDSELARDVIIYKLTIDVYLGKQHHMCYIRMEMNRQNQKDLREVGRSVCKKWPPINH